MDWFLRFVFVRSSSHRSSGCSVVITTFLIFFPLPHRLSPLLSGAALPYGPGNFFLVFQGFVSALSFTYPAACAIVTVIMSTKWFLRKLEANYEKIPARSPGPSSGTADGGRTAVRRRIGGFGRRSYQPDHCFAPDGAAVHQRVLEHHLFRPADGKSDHVHSRRRGNAPGQLRLGADVLLHRVFRSQRPGGSGLSGRCRHQR